MPTEKTPRRMPGWLALGLGLASGVLVGLGGGGMAVLAVGVVTGVAVVLARRAPVVGGAAGLAAAIAAIGASDANDGSLKTFALAVAYGLAVGAVVGVAASKLSNVSTPRAAPATALIALLLAAGILGAIALPAPRLAMTGTSDRAAVAAGIAPQKLARIDRFVRAQLKHNHQPGVAFSIVGDGRIMLERGYGVAGSDRRPMTPDTPEIIASLSKTITAVALATLVEQGKVRLDDPVQTYLPWFRVADPVASKAITVRHLMTHSSGIGWASFWAGLIKTSGHSLEDEVRALRTVELEFPPGQGSTYSNSNFQTVGLIVQVVSGQPFGRYLEDHVLRPSHMTSSFAASFSPGRVPVASGYRGWFGVPVPMKQTFSDAAKPSGSMYSTAHDLGLYLLSHLGRADLAAVSPATYTTLHTPYGDKAEHAMDWSVSRTAGVTTALGHGGLAPGATSNLSFHPAAGWGIAAILNYQALGQENVDPLADGLDAIMAGDAAPTVHTRAQANVVLGLVAALVLMLLARAFTTLGRWRSKHRRWVVVARVAWLAITGLLLPAAFFLGLNSFGNSEAGIGSDPVGLFRAISVYLPDVALLAFVAVVGMVVVAAVRAGVLVTGALRASGERTTL